MNIAMPATVAPTFEKADSKGVLNSVPAWGSYLYQNFLLPAFSPNIANEWLNLNSPFASSNTANNTNSNVVADYFSQAWAPAEPVKTEPVEPTPVFNNANLNANANSIQSQSLAAQFSLYQQASTSVNAPNFAVSAPQQQYYQSSWFDNGNSGISTSLLVAQPQASSSSSSSQNISPSISVEAVDAQVSASTSASPSPMHSLNGTPRISAVKLAGGTKRRASSMDSDDQASHDEHEPEVPEGVERDGMIWGMKVEDYRALSARERKRVRNRISARTFRAKRKEHLSSLEHTISNKDLQIKLAGEEALRLKKEVAELKKRLSQYEPVAL